MTATALGEVVARVEAELAAFWGAPDRSGGAPLAKVRAATMTYVAVAPAGEIDRLRAEIGELAASHPARAILITADPAIAPGEARADVDAVCELGGPVALCHDRVEIALGALAAARARSVIATLALPEVPVVVEVAPGAPDALATPLLARADRLVVDSDRTPIARIDALARATGAPLADRGFVRTFTWRELVARLFDPDAGAARAIRRVVVRRAPSPVVEPAAPLFGWLASRLGWCFEGRALARDASGAPVELAVEDDPRADVPPGAITAVAVDAAVAGRPIALRCERTADPAVVRWSTRGAREASHDHRLGHRDEVWVLAKAIDAGPQDRVVRDALRAAAAWCSS